MAAEYVIRGGGMARSLAGVEEQQSTGIGRWGTWVNMRRREPWRRAGWYAGEGFRGGEVGRRRRTAEGWAARGGWRPVRRIRASVTGARRGTVFFLDEGNGGCCRVARALRSSFQRACARKNLGLSFVHSAVHAGASPEIRLSMFVPIRYTPDTYLDRSPAFF